MEELIAFIFSGFWIYAGFFLLLCVFLQFLQSAWHTFWRHYTIRKHGYPPPHCDADGEFKQETQQE